MSEPTLYRLVKRYDDESGEPLWDELELLGMMQTGVLVPEPDHLDIDEMDDKERVFSIARHAAKRYLELCGQGDGAWGRVTEFLDDAALGIGGDDEAV